MNNELHKYWAFISYSHKDKKWGDWLHKTLERYHIPAHLVGKETREGIVPKRIFPVFRDREELPTSADLGSNISEALRLSRYLVVICSPNSAASFWVNEEIRQFKKMGKANKVLCLIVDGEPNDLTKECFPDAIKFQVTSNGEITTIPVEPIAADVRPGKDGRQNAKLKLLAGITGLSFDALKQREKQRSRQRKVVGSVSALALTATIVFLSSNWWFQKKQTDIAHANQLVRSAMMAIGNYDLDEGVQQLGAIDTEDLRELEMIAPLYQSWLQYMVPIEERLFDLESNHFYRWQNQTFFVNQDRIPFKLPDLPLLSGVVSVDKQKLYVLLDSHSSHSSHSSHWEIHVYDTQSKALISEYKVPEYLSGTGKLFTAKNSNHVVFSAEQKTAVAATDTHLYLVEEKKITPLVADNTHFVGRPYGSDSCERFLMEEGNKVTLYSFVTASSQTLDYIDLTHKIRLNEQQLMEKIQQQIQSQGVFMVYNGDDFTLYNQNGKALDSWFLESYGDICSEETPISDFYFPYTLEEAQLWQIDNIGPQDESASEPINLDTTRPSVFYVEKAMASNWKVDDWMPHEKWNLLSHFTLSDGSKAAGEADSPVSVDSLTFTPITDHKVLVSSVGYASDFTTLYFCLLDLKLNQFGDCGQDGNYSDFVGDYLISPKKRFIYMPYEDISGVAFKLYDTETLKEWVSDISLFGFLPSKSQVAFNADETQVAIYSDYAVEIFSINEGKLTRVNQFRLNDTASLHAYTPNYSSVSYVNPAQLVYLDEDKLIYRERDNKLRMRDTKQNIGIWQIELDFEFILQKPAFIRLDPVHDQLAVYNQSGIQLFQLSTGYPLSQIFAFEVSDAEQGEDESALLVVDFDTDGALRVKLGEALFKRPTSTTAVEQDKLWRYTARKDLLNFVGLDKLLNTQKEEINE